MGLSQYCVIDGDIKENDIVLMVSLDGAQLYEHKDLDFWMYVWILINLSPKKCYHKVQVHPGGFIPSPKKLKKSWLLSLQQLLSPCCITNGRPLHMGHQP